MRINEFAASTIAVSESDGDHKASSDHPVPVYHPANTPVDRSGTIAQANLAQDVFAANPDRRGCWILNPDSNTASIWVSDVGTATAASPSEEIKPGDEWEPSSGSTSGAVSIICSVVSQPFTAREW